MKLYIRARNKFLKISIVVLLLALMMIFVFHMDVFGNFLLGIFASTLIITMQYDLSSKVEESKLIIDKLKKIIDFEIDFDEIYTFSLEYFTCNFEEKFAKYRKKLEVIFNLNNELGNISDLNISTKKDLNIIINKIDNLETDLYIIFKNFDSANKQMKIIYFIEFYNIIKRFNFNELFNYISHLGWKIDEKKFYQEDYKEKKQVKFKDTEYSTSISIYNTKLEKQNSIEYESLKKEFEKYMK